MALGGGTWSTQNKILPGTYVNFASTATASATLSDRGYVAMPLQLDWGPTDTVFTVTSGDFQTDSQTLFGYDYTADALLPLRELFQYASTLYAYRLNGGGVKAANTFCTALYAGTLGNTLYTVISTNVDDDDYFDVDTYTANGLVDSQTVASASELVDNGYVSFISTATLAATAKTPLTGGTNSTVTATNHQTFLDKIESYSFNALGCPTDDTTTINLYVNYTERMRDEVGANFQTVVYNPVGATQVADYEGVISVGNAVTGYDSSLAGLGDYGLVYWVAGASAGCAVNSSNTHKWYNGALTVDTDYTQTQLETAILSGRFQFHSVDGAVRVLDDINSLTTTTDTKGEVFQANQTIRVMDQIANDVAVTFQNKYLGVVPNDADGRISLWSDICTLIQDLETQRAVEDFDTSTVTVAQGTSKKAVVFSVSELNVVNAMAQLYMSVMVS